MNREFLNPNKRLVDEVADWLVGQSKISAGVKVLDHLLVIVPTREAGRRLRLALAQRLGGYVPPKIRLPAQMIIPAEDGSRHPVATLAESMGVLADLLMRQDVRSLSALFPEKGPSEKRTFEWALGVSEQLHELWRILQENALSMSHVAERIEELLKGELLDLEMERWRNLATLEERLFERLEALGRMHPTRYRMQAVETPASVHGIGRIILPAITDAQPALYPVLERLPHETTVLIHADEKEGDRFDRWGRPIPSKWLGAAAPQLPLMEEQIRLMANTQEQARRVAEYFAGIPVAEASPGLGMADEALFPELQAAFLEQHITLRNPADYPVKVASLGRVIRQLSQLCQHPTYRTLAAFLRENDVREWLIHHIGADFSYSDLLRELDEVQNGHLPLTLAEVRAWCTSDSRNGSSLDKATEAIGTLLVANGRSRQQHLFAMLKTLFAARRVSERKAGDRELVAAAESVREVMESLDSDVLAAALDPGQRAQLMDVLLASATYSLESETSTALMTDGWLELQWNPDAELVLTGFNEGAVPDAVVGHTFLPDALRMKLGLTSNDGRMARDTFLFRSLLLSREAQAVIIFLERLNAQNEVCKPSRLLFLCDSATLAVRAHKLYSDAEATPSGYHRTLPDAWRLALPMPGTEGAPIPGKVSVTSLQSYLKSPLTFFLKDVMKMRSVTDDVRELDALYFGNLCHAALEVFAKSEVKDSDDEQRIEHFLHHAIHACFERQVGTALTTVLMLQQEAACRRMSDFAKHQAKLIRDGWRIHAVEQKMSLVVESMTITGRMDRLDYHEATQTWRVLDYKTWTELGKNDGWDRFSTTRKPDFPSPAPFEGMNDSRFPRYWTDLQLPLYVEMVRTYHAIPAHMKIECGYFVLGRDASRTCCRTWDFTEMNASAHAAVRWLVRRIQAGVFWPAGSLADEFAPLFPSKVEEGIAFAWLGDQEDRQRTIGEGHP